MLFYQLISILYGIGQFLFLFIWWINGTFPYRRRIASLLIIITLSSFPAYHLQEIIAKKLKIFDVKKGTYLSYFRSFWKSLLFLCGLLYLESTDRYALAPCAVLRILYLILMGEHILEILAFFTVYTNSSRLITLRFTFEAATPVLYMVFMLGLVVGVYTAKRKLTDRILHQIRLLRLVKFRQAFEVRVTEEALGNKVSDMGFTTLNIVDLDTPLKEAQLLSAAVDKNLLKLPRDYSSHCMSLRGAERHLCTVIVIKQCCSNSHDSIQNSIILRRIQDFLDKLAENHQITPVRRFRGLWIGSLGYFESWKQSRLNTCHVVQMASEVIYLSRRFGWQLSCAIDQGSIIGGYIGEKMSFDMLGSEVRWATSAVDETHNPNEVFISPTVRNTLMSDAVLSSGMFDVDVLSSRTIKPKSKESEHYYSIDNTLELLSRTPEELYALFVMDNKSDQLNWDHVNEIWSADASGYFQYLSDVSIEPKLGSFYEDELSYSDSSVNSMKIENHSIFGKSKFVPAVEETAATTSRNLFSSTGRLIRRDFFSSTSSSDFRSMSLSSMSAIDIKSLDSVHNHAISETTSMKRLLSDGDLADEGYEGEENVPLGPKKINRPVATKSLRFRSVNPSLDRPSNSHRLWSPKQNAKDDFVAMAPFISWMIDTFLVLVDSDSLDDSYLAKIEKLYLGECNKFPGNHLSFGVLDGPVELKEIFETTNELMCKYHMTSIFEITSAKDAFKGLQKAWLQGQKIHDAPFYDATADLIPSPRGVLYNLLHELPLLILDFAVIVLLNAWFLLYHAIMNERFDLTVFPVLQFLQKMYLKYLRLSFGAPISPAVSSSVEDTPIALEGPVENADDTARQSPALLIDEDSTKVASINCAEDAFDDAEQRSKEKIVRYGESWRLEIGKSMTGLLSVISIFTMVTATHMCYSSRDSDHKPAYSFQYLSMIYTVVIMIYLESFIKGKAVYFMTLLAKLVVIGAVPLSLHSNYDGESTFTADGGKVEYSRPIDIIYFVFIHMMFGTLTKPLRFAYLDCLMVSFGLLMRYAFIDQNDEKQFSIVLRLQLILYFSIITILANMMIEYYVTMLYVLDVVIAPKAKESLLAQHKCTKTVIHMFLPMMEPEAAMRILREKRYSNTAIITMHVKPYDTLPSLVTEKEAVAFLLLIHDLLDTCFAECGFIRIQRFSGIFIAVLADNSGFDMNLGHMNRSMSCRKRALLCVRHIQKRLDIFNRTNRVNISMGVSICSGTVSIGVSKLTSFSLSVSGYSVGVGSLLSVRETDNIVVDETYAPDIKKSLSSHTKPFLEMLPGRPLASRFYSVVLDEGSFGGQGKTLNDFTYNCMLGKGGYGSVHLVIDKKYGIKYAIKCIPKKKGGSAADVMITREFLILTQMQHPNVIKLKYCIMSESCVYLVMEYVRGGSLKQVIEKYNIELDTLKLWFAELVLAIEYCHSLGIQHRDVKPVNCMIQFNGHLKLGDFGLAKIVQSEVSLSNSTTQDKSSETHESDEDDFNQTDNAISIMQKVLPIYANQAQIYGLIQALVIDSDVERREQTCSVLKNMMVEAVVLNTEAEIKDILNAPHSPIDLILLDVGPNLDGPEWALLKELRTKSSTESIPVIAQSGYDDTAMEDKAIELGAKKFISHPLHANVDRDAIFACGMTRQVWRLEESGYNSNSSSSTGSASRQLQSSAGVRKKSVSPKVNNPPGFSVKSITPGAITFNASPASGNAKANSELSSADLGNKDFSRKPSPAVGYRRESAMTALLTPVESLPSNKDSQAPVGDMPMAGQEQGDVVQLIASSDLQSPILIAESTKNEETNASTEASMRAELSSLSAISRLGVSTRLSGKLKSFHKDESVKKDEQPEPVEKVGPGGTPASPNVAADRNNADLAIERNSAVGTANFMAPEIILEKIYDKSVDWWACGVTFYYCITKHHLFKGSDPNAIFRNIKNRNMDLSEIDAVSPELKELIAGLLNYDYKERLGSVSVDDIKRQRFFSPSFEAVCNLEPTFLPPPLEEITVSQAEKDAGEELYYNRKTVKKKVRVTTTSYSTRDLSLGKSRSKKKSSSSKSSKRQVNLSRFNRVANSIREYSIAEVDEEDDNSGGFEGSRAHGDGDSFSHPRRYRDSSLVENASLEDKDYDYDEMGHKEISITSGVHDNLELANFASRLTSSKMFQDTNK